MRYCKSAVPGFENLHNIVHLNDNMNGALVDSKSDEEILLDISGFHDEKVLIKQSLTCCDHSESHCEEGNDIFTLNGRINGRFASKNVINLSKQKLTEETSLLSKGLKLVPTSHHFKT